MVWTEIRLGVLNDFTDKGSLRMRSLVDCESDIELSLPKKTKTVAEAPYILPDLLQRYCYLGKIYKALPIKQYQQHGQDTSKGSCCWLATQGRK
jgi:hypothetical protein